MATYETYEDMQRQQAFADFLQKKWWDRDLIPTYQYCPVDYAFKRMEIVLGWLEIKVRNISSKEYPDAICGLAKWEAIKEMTRVHRKPTVYAIKYTDINLMWGFNWRKSYPVKMMKRRDRPGEYPVVLIPLSEFKVI